jgi:hypothetical protein
VIALAACAFVAFSCEALAGFGGTVLALALGAEVRPLPELLAIFIPANMALSLALLVRHREVIDWRLLGRRILPAMALGLPFGLLVEHFAKNAFQPLFAAVVIGLAILEALRLRARQTGSLRGGALLLGLAGVVHGAYGTGGPLVVFVTGRDVPDKQAFRATLAMLWLVLNAVLVIGFVLHGWLGARTLGETVMLLPVVAGALALGEWCAARIPDRPFRAFGAALLGAAGLLLLVRGG